MDLSPTYDQFICLVDSSFLHDTDFNIWIMNDYNNPTPGVKTSHISSFIIPRDIDDKLNEPIPEKIWVDIERGLVENKEGILLLPSHTQVYAVNQVV